MKPQYAALLRQVDELGAKVGHRQRTYLRAIVPAGEDQKAAMEKAVAEWMRRHPKAKARSVDSFDWIIRAVAKPPRDIPPVHLELPPSRDYGWPSQRIETAIEAADYADSGGRGWFDPRLPAPRRA
jgi:hypothetical protein